MPRGAGFAPSTLNPDLLRIFRAAVEFSAEHVEEGLAAVLREGEDLLHGELRAWCKERIASYKAPSRLELVDALPRNALGKVTKPDVAALFA